MNLTGKSWLGVVAAAGLATIAAGLAPAAAQPSTQASTPAVHSYRGTAGLARSARPTAQSGTAAVRKGVRRMPSSHYAATQVLPRVSASASATPAPARRSPTVNFNGVSSRDSQRTNFQAMFEPPDQGLCEGNSFVLEPVNSAYRIYRTTGQSLRGPFNVNNLFDVGGRQFTSDPRCWFDRSTQTWFATILFINSASSASSLRIAVRHNPSPIGAWKQYSINTTDAGGNGCPCFSDQPRLGIDQTNLYVTGDEFSITGTQFNGAELWAIDKTDLVNGVSSPHFAHFANLTTDTSAPQPALSRGTPNAEYMLSSLDPTGKGDDRVGVWAVTNRDQVGAGSTPTLTSLLIDSEKYAVPPPAVQKGSGNKVDSGDDRMQSTQFVGGTIWGELTTAVTPDGDNATRAGGAWFQVRPTLGASGITGASIDRQGYLAARGGYQIYPAVQPDAAGNAAVIFTVTSKSQFPSAAYALLGAGDSNFGPTAVAAAGQGPYTNDATRWGDYSFAVPDDATDAAWLATEYVPPKASQTTTGRRPWGTRVLEIPLS